MLQIRAAAAKLKKDINALEAEALRVKSLCTLVSVSLEPLPITTADFPQTGLQKNVCCTLLGLDNFCILRL